MVLGTYKEYASYTLNCERKKNIGPSVWTIPKDLLSHILLILHFRKAVLTNRCLLFIIQNVNWHMHAAARTLCGYDLISSFP